MAEIYVHKIGIANDVEYAVLTLENLFKDELSSYEGKIWIIPSADMFNGTGVHDIDIIVIGYLKGYKLNDVLQYKNIDFKSFCTTIEVKSHDITGVHSDGTKLVVDYDNGSKDVTGQSSKQKNTLRKYFDSTLLGKKPFVTNLIWLVGIQKSDVKNLGMAMSNIISLDSTVSDIFETVSRQVGLQDNGFVDCFRHYDDSSIEDVANFFCKKVDGIDTMTLRRLNILKHDNEIINRINDRTTPIVVLSGHAGTGKTIMLLQAALNLVKSGHKCLFLTYNSALIADLKHTMLYLEPVSLQFESMHSFLISLFCKNGLWNQSKNIENDFMFAAKQLLNKKNAGFSTEYEYVFIDEAQDWPSVTIDLLKKIFADKHIVVADGVDQFMQKCDQVSWNVPQNEILKKCLRQRRNLSVFVKIFASKLGISWNVIPNEKLPGGKVKLYSNYDVSIHNKLLDDLKDHYCTEYDMMILAPNSLIKNNGFALKENYENAGIHIYDGIANKHNVYGMENANNKECRIYTYESCRGLEAWTTVCLRFDELFEKPHSHDYKEISYEIARKYMLSLWSLIPLTRAIDTLALVVDPNSQIGKVLVEISKENPDLVENNLQN